MLKCRLLALALGRTAVQMTSHLVHACLYVSLSTGTQSYGPKHGICLPPYYKAAKIILQLIYLALTHRKTFLCYNLIWASWFILSKTRSRTKKMKTIVKNAQRSSCCVCFRLLSSTSLCCFIFFYATMLFPSYHTIKFYLKEKHVYPAFRKARQI